MTLDELGIKYKTDKSSAWHDYLNTYEKHFASFREKPIRLLEIGVSSANSLKMWRDFFLNGYICGIDVDPNCLNYKEPGYDIFMCDQTDEKNLTLLCDNVGPFDIIIDDGSHMMGDINYSFHVLFPLLANNGLYAVEDLHTCYLPQYNKNSQNSLYFFKEFIDDINLGGKNINSDICASRQRQFSRLEGKMAFSKEEISINAIHFYSSLVIVEKKLLEKNSGIEKEFK